MKVKKVFTLKPMISFCSGREGTSYLVRARLYLEERTKGSFKCGSKRCKVCQSVNETSTLTSLVAGETYIINHKFNCNENCLVYLLTCNCYKNNAWVKQSTNFVLDRIIIKVIVGKINVVKHVCNNTCMRIFAAATIIIL